MIQFWKKKKLHTQNMYFCVNNVYSVNINLSLKFSILDAERSLKHGCCVSREDTFKLYSKQCRLRLLLQSY